MQVVVSGKHLDVSEALQEHATQRARKACEHLTSPPANCKVILAIDANTNKAEMAIHHRGRDFFAQGESADDMYVAIDAASNKLRRQLDDFNGKEQASRR